MLLFERCREARRRTGLSQESLAMELGVSRGAVAQWEMKNGTAPGVENMAALARRTGVAFEWLATGRGVRVFGEPMGVAEDVVVYGTLTAEQRSLLAAFDRLHKNKRAALLELLKPAS